MTANPEFDYHPPQSPVFDLIYQDDDILVLNKPSGLLSVPGRKPELRDSLIVRVNRVFPTATVVHRLDMDTSGVVLFPLNRDAHANLGQQFEKRQTEKRYLARIAGRLVKNQGQVNLPLLCDWPNRPKHKVDMKNGKPALTRYQVLEVEPSGSSRVALYPVTGRSHQLRVHMLALGHPILGDSLYAKGADLAAADRLQLHAEYLKIRHPVSGEWLEFTAACPF